MFHDFYTERYFIFQFKPIQQEFQDLIAKLATEYCATTNGFQHQGTINATTVEVNSVLPCPTDWPDAELCVNTNISVPLNTTELSVKHLREMWKMHSNSQLAALGLKDYELPSNYTVLILWLSVTGILFVLFIIILIFVIKTKFIENYIRRRRDILGSSNRSWLSQHGEKQLVPPFFYPDPPRTKLKEDHSHYGSEADIRKRGFGMENPVYDPELVVIPRVDNQISQSTIIVDDFDSDDETIYPPSLSRPVQQRNDRGNNVKMADELETAL
ncbi:hypothetical protein J6590_013926 [Homalodisca vitripennis]|nr:hypothetical protein J6590_013926 [Homalodisca vitripennis]